MEGNIIETLFLNLSVFATLLLTFLFYWFKLSFIYLFRPLVFLFLFLFAFFKFYPFLFSALFFHALLLFFFSKNNPKNWNFIWFKQKFKKWFFLVVLFVVLAAGTCVFGCFYPNKKPYFILLPLFVYLFLQGKRWWQRAYKKEKKALFLDLSTGFVLIGVVIQAMFATPSLWLSILLLIFQGGVLFSIFYLIKVENQFLGTLNKAYKEKLFNSEKAYVRIFENSPAMYVLLNINFTILDCNKKFLESVGLPLEQVISYPLEEFMHDLFKNKLKLFKNYLKFHKDSSGEFALYNAQKKDTMDVFLSAIKDEESIFVIMQDITTIKWMQNSLLSYAEQLKKEMEHSKNADRMKSAFLANMSHEIRTPLTSIIGFSSLLNETGLNETQKDYVAKVASSGEHLLKIINDIIDLSKIEAGKMDVEIEKTNLNRIFSELYDIVYPYFNNKPIQFKIIAQEVFQNHYFLLDGFRLKQVFINLVSNAVKFTEEGSVKLSCFIENHEVVFTVTDTGIGIAEDKQGIIFDSFVQAEDSLHRVYGGTGLGLAISKRLVELMGGNISLSSEEKVGTTMRLAFPYNVLSEKITNPNNEKLKQALEEKQNKKPSLNIQQEKTGEENEEIESPKNQNPSLSPTLLVAEDNESVFQLLEFVLRKNQVHMVRAKDGEEALELYEKHKASLKTLLLDINLPKIDGISVAQKIKTENSDLFFIGFSGFTYDEVKDRAAGVLNGYIKKPFKINEIYNLLKDYL